MNAGTPAAHPLAAEVALATSLVREAGGLALRMRAEGLSTARKSNVADLVTSADHAAEELVVSRLAELRPADGVLGEEGSERGGTSGRTWVIDPVDGTWNFASGLSWWCSALALRDEGGVLLGAVHHPVEGATFVGGPDLPTTRNGIVLPSLADQPLGEGCVTTYLHSPHLETPVGAAFRRVLQSAATYRMLGSGSMDHTAVAQGHAAVFVQHTVAEWDRLPGEALVAGVGGVSDTLQAAGVSWTICGTPSAVTKVGEALRER